nr:MAG TPA: minor tail protein [Caudoviricetes sp.]
MSDYTLSAKITADSKSYESGMDRAEQATKQFNEETQRTPSKLEILSNKFKSAMNSAKNFSGKMSDLSGKFKSFGNDMMKSGALMTAGITTPMTLATKNMVSAASDFEENLNKIDVAFKGSSQYVKDWADTALESFGLSKNQALEAAALFGDMGTSMGLTDKAAAEMATSLAGLAGDMASFKNVDIGQAMTALNGVFTGETESLKQLGIVMTEVNLEEFANSIGKSYKNMTQAEKVQLRYNYVMKMTANAQGDYARTSDGAANSMRTFQGSVDNLMIAFGQNLLPVFTPIVQGLTDMVNWFANLDSSVQTMIISVGLLIAAIGPVKTIIGGISTGIGGLMSAMSFLTSPMGMVVIAIGAIVAAGYLLISHWEELKAFALETWNGIQEVFARFDAWLTGIFQTDWTRSFGAFGNVLNAFFANVENVWKSVKRAFSGVIDFIAGIFTGNWTRAWNGIVKIFGGIFGGIVSIAKAPINGLIGIVNTAISGLNSISVDIPDWVPLVGGQHWGLDIGHIPYLLHGTDDWQGGFARMNEGGRGELTYLPNGTQVIPHDISVKYAKESARLTAVADPLSMDSVLDGVSIPIYVDAHMNETTLLKKVYDYTIRKIGNQYKAILAGKGR